MIRSNCKSYTDLVFHVNSDKCPPIPENLSENCKDFIRTCCTFDKKERPTATKLKNHSYLLED